MRQRVAPVDVADMDRNEFASAMAPLIFFDGVPTFGVSGPIVSLTLEAITYSAVNGTVTPARTTVAHLRTTLKGLEHLRAALDGLRLLAHPHDGPM